MIDPMPEPTPARRRPRILARFAIAFLVGMLAALALGVGALYAYDQQYVGRVLPGISVGSVSLAGLDREAAIAREDAEYLDAAAATIADRLISRTPAAVEISPAAVLCQPPAIARRVIRLAQQIASGGRFVGFDAVDAVLAFSVSKSAGPLDLPGHRVNRRGDVLVLTRSVGRHPAEAPVTFTYQLGVPGNVNVPEAGCAISAEVSSVPSGRSAAEIWTLASRSDEAVLEAARLAGPL